MAPFLMDAAAVVFALQTAQATVHGTVRNEATGQALADAVILLTDLNRSTATDSRGRYVLHDVPPGPQHLTVRYLGYAQRSLHALVPAEGQVEINVALRPEALRLSTLEARSDLRMRGVEEDSAAIYDRGSSIAAIRNHPLLAEPDGLQALEGGGVVLRPESPSGVHIRGGSSDQTGYLLDGIPVLSPYHAAGLFSAWNPDALSGVYLASSLPLSGYSNALAGTIAAATRTPGPRLGAQGSLSTTQARLTMDGQIGRTGTGYLLSLRTGIPGSPVPQRDPSYLRAESGDWLAKLESPVLGGRARLLAYGSDNETDAAVQSEPGDQGSLRNNFEWASRSVGGEWKGRISGLGVKLLGWSASADASSGWNGRQGRVALSSFRRDLGILGEIELRDPEARTLLGIRVERSSTSYRIRSTAALSELSARTPLATAFAQHARSLAPEVELTLGGSLTASDEGWRLGPHGRVRWKPANRFTLTGSYTRVHQFAQSLRNPESVVGNIFPVDLYLGSGSPGVPAARSDLFVGAAEYRAWNGVRLEAEVYRRQTNGLVLVAPQEGGPFSTTSFSTGSGSTTGLALDASMSRARFGIVASYGWQRLVLTYRDAGYVPDYGTSHLLHGGVILFPTTTLSFKLGATGALGRRTTTATGGLEWESCNLLDQGCEFSGSPDYTGQPLGAAVLPHYLRVDLGVRKHWHFEFGGRDAMVALFGTITNLLGRTNVLTYVRDPATGKALPIKMRPLAPLLVGLDWRF